MKKAFEFIQNYQLEFLIENQINFSFFNFSEKSISSLKKQETLLKENDLEKHTETLEKNAPIILACKTGNLSEKIASFLCEKGFINVYVLEKGLESFSKDSSE